MPTYREMLRNPEFYIPFERDTNVFNYVEDISPNLDNIVSVDIEWNLQFGNSANIMFTLYEAPKINTCLWRFHSRLNKSYYIRRDGHGFTEMHFHKAASIIEERKNSNGQMETVYLTPRSEGYAGREFPIQMEDGRTVILRGPWHGSAPRDMHLKDVSTRELNSKYSCYTFGLKASHHLIQAAMKRFHPELQLYQDVRYGWLTVDKAMAPQEEIDKFRKANKNQEYVDRILNAIGIPY